MALDPDCVRVHEIYKMAGRPPLETLSPAEAREGMKKARAVFSPDAPDMGEVRDLTCPGPAGAIGLRLYRPKSAEPDAKLPVLVYYHGGGWVIGDLDTHDVLCRELSIHSGAAVVSVDYRLAPEHVFPAAVDDAYAATKWIAENGVALGLDTTRLAVGGDSAGGNLAIVVALMARDAGGPAIKHQLLIYPATDTSGRQVSLTENAAVLPLTKAVMDWFWVHYAGGQNVLEDWRAAPLVADTLINLPPAYVITAGYDVLRDEGLDFADKLEAAKVLVTRKHFPGQIHGFITMGKVVREANTAVADAGAALKAALA
jgi:acetyl esterase